LSQLSVQAGRHLADEVLEAGGAIISEVGVMSAVVDDRQSADERLVAALSDGVVVIESGEIPNIARCADSYSRSLMALPGRASDALSWGANRMIATSMAQMVCSGRDIVRILEEEN
jgi:DNA processing protein